MHNKLRITTFRMDTVAKKQTSALKGGEFLIRETAAQDIFIPEEFSEEQLMMAQSCQDFLEQEIFPHVERMDSLEPGFMENLMNKAGELGLLGVSVPEEYGGMGMSFNTSMLFADILGAGGSFATAFGAHTGIGTLPIQYYGNETQKATYLPKLGTGEWKACYCLTEPDAGSDANSGKTKAVLNEAGTHYHITGQKMWISNAGFAHVMIVFARIEDDKNITAFIVERDYGGITFGDEEKKMGIKGSSTRQVFFENTPVPVENILGERNGGFKIAVNILNIGRIKLAASAIGGARMVIDKAIQYTKERKQFGQPIASFGAIQHKLAEMAIRVYASESASYRAGQNIEDQINHLLAEGVDKQSAVLKGVEQFAIEAAMMKVHGSEVIDFVVDEGVQIYGGMGFSADAPMERAYRDARIARIYEGTNEINRMLTLGMIMKRAMKGQLDLLGPAKEVANDLMSLPDFGDESDELFAQEKKTVANLKKAVLMVSGKAAQDLGQQLNEEQEVLMSLADMVIELYVAESTLLRAEKVAQIKGESAARPHILAAQVYLSEATDKIWLAGKEAIAAFAEDDDQTMLMMGLKRFTKTALVNTKKLRRELAEELIDREKYFFFRA